MPTTDSCTAANALYFDMPGGDLRAEGASNDLVPISVEIAAIALWAGPEPQSRTRRSTTIKARDNGMRMINPTIATTITMTTTCDDHLGIAEALTPTTSAAAMLR